MERRTFLAMVPGSLLAAPLAAEAQQAGKVPRIGFLGSTSPSDRPPPARRVPARAARARVRRGPEHRHRVPIGGGTGTTAFPTWRPSWSGSKVDVIVRRGTHGAQAPRTPPRRSPSSWSPCSDPVEHGLVASLARPGGNVTGLSLVRPELAPSNWSCSRRPSPGPPCGRPLESDQSRTHQLAIARRRTGGPVVGRAASAPGGCEARASSTRAFAAMAKERVRARSSSVGCDAQLPREHGSQTSRPGSRLPAVYGISEIRRGRRPHGLRAELSSIAYRRAAAYVDKILKGTKPADLPVEQPTQVRAGHQPQDRQGPRPDDPAVAAAAGGSGDRVMDRRAFLLASLAGAPRRAARRRSAAGGEGLPHWLSRDNCAHPRHASPLGSVPGRAPRGGLCRGPESLHRAPVLRGQGRALHRFCFRVRPAPSGRDCCVKHSSGQGSETSDRDDPNCDGVRR